MNAPILSNPSVYPNLLSAAPRTFDLPIAGLTPFTTIDLPGRLAAVVYTQGCAWQCRYCHNASMQPFREGRIPFADILDFLNRRKGFLDGLVFCGGEPTAHDGLAAAMQAVKDEGFMVGLHTTGVVPERLSRVLPYCDWVGMDVKAPIAMYEKVTRRPNSASRVRESISLLIESRVDHEIRTTVHPALLSQDEILQLAAELSSLGVQNYVLQVFHTQGCVDGALVQSAPREFTIPAALQERLAQRFRNFTVRN